MQLKVDNKKRVPSVRARLAPKDPWQPLHELVVGTPLYEAVKEYASAPARRNWDKTMIGAATRACLKWLAAEEKGEDPYEGNLTAAAPDAVVDMLAALRRMRKRDEEAFDGAVKMLRNINKEKKE